VARNVALAELLFELPEDRVEALLATIAGVRWERQSAAVGGHVLLTQALERQDPDQRRAVLDQVLAGLTDLAERDDQAREIHARWTRRFYDLLSSFAFLPNSPTLMNAGRRLQQLSACYVIPVPDTMDGILDALKAQALIHKSGGGTGFSFGRLREAGAGVASTSGVASGPLSFMTVFDRMTAVVKQGGTRRGANMAVLPYTHPDIREFVRAKREGGLLENFNLSVAVDEALFEAAAAGAEIELRSPASGEVTERVPARDLLDLIARCAWETGDPGLVFFDRINASNANPTPADGAIEAVNPCGEQPLFPYEPCNLGSLNLAKFVRGPLLAGEVDWAALGETVDLAVRFLDDVIEVNRYPLPQIERIARTRRRIGLGIMGFAELCVHLGVAYGTAEAEALAEQVMGFVDRRALAASEALGVQRGVYPAWAGSAHDPESPHFRGASARPRHCARTTIAPTGTIAIAAGLMGSGIEPFFALSYRRFTAKAIDAQKEGREPDAAHVYHQVQPHLLEIAREQGFFGHTEEDLIEAIERNGGSLRGVPGVPDAIASVFVTAHELAPAAHIRMQAAFQRHTDHAVSKTINLPRAATVEGVRRAYELAYEHGLKGITVYRDGSKRTQVLSTRGGASGIAECEGPVCPSC
jgi:ribonucleoside-diphosphate reductase alpha chain